MDNKLFNQDYFKYRYEARRLILANMRGLSRSDIEDVYSELSIKLTKISSQIKQAKNEEAMLRTIVKNFVIDKIRKQQYETGKFVSLDTPVIDNEGNEKTYYDFIPDREPSILDKLVQEEDSGNLWDKVKKLPEEFAVVLVLIFQFGLTVSEVAARLKISFKTVYTRLFRAKNLIGTA
jgi:RNA polymerase sigma factor (sigma-70 family)